MTLRDEIYFIFIAKVFTQFYYNISNYCADYVEYINHSNQISFVHSRGAIPDLRSEEKSRSTILQPGQSLIQVSVSHCQKFCGMFYTLNSHQKLLRFKWTTNRKLFDLPANFVLLCS